MASTGIAIVEAFLEANLETDALASINGHLIVGSGTHSIAVHDRRGVSWVAEFRDGRGELMRANTWFYFHAHRLGYWQRRQAYKGAQPLPLPMVVEIERLHRQREAREAASATARCKITLEQAAARLHRALETVAGGDDSSRADDQRPRRSSASAVQRPNGLMAIMRGFLSGRNRTAG